MIEDFRGHRHGCEHGDRQDEKNRGDREGRLEDVRPRQTFKVVERRTSRDTAKSVGAGGEAEVPAPPFKGDDPADHVQPHRNHQAKRDLGNPEKRDAQTDDHARVAGQHDIRDGKSRIGQDDGDVHENHAPPPVTKPVQHPAPEELAQQRQRAHGGGHQPHDQRRGATHGEKSRHRRGGQHEERAQAPHGLRDKQPQQTAPKRGI
jgi:hypothetical protein